jgi:hypothetical protein
MTLNDQFISNLQTHPHIQKYPHLTPWVGSRYATSKFKKILLIAESHYLPHGVTFHRDDAQWYEGNQNILKEKIEEQATHNKSDGLKFINTSGILKQYAPPNAIKRFKRGHTIYRNLFDVLNKSYFCHSDKSHSINDVAYYNFFQRPAAKPGDSIKETVRDVSEAQSMLKHTLNILKPDIVVFVSKKAGKYGKRCIQPQISSFITTHPASSWWNRPSKKNNNKSGKQLLIDFLTEHL